MSSTGESSKRPLKDDSSTENPRGSSIEVPLPRDFSEFLSERFSHWRKLKNSDPDDKIAFALWSEHQLLEQQIVAEELDEEIYHSCLKESNLSFLIVLLYMSNMFNIDNKKTSILGPKLRRMEKLRLLTSNAKISKDEIELMVKISSNIKGPHTTKSHLESIKVCIRYAQEWIDGDSNLVLGTPISYAMLKKSVKEIVGSDYFRSLPPSPLERRGYHMNYFDMTFATWLEHNSNKILDELPVTSTDGEGKSQKKYKIKAFRLSPDVRRILWGVLRKLQELHKESQVCGALTLDNIYINSQSLEVEFRTKVTHGEYLDDFKKMKILLENVLKYASPLYEIKSRCPEDLRNFMELIEEGNKVCRDVLYNHPFVWSTCDSIKSIYLFTAIYESSIEDAQLDMTTCMEFIPESIQANWKSSVLPGSSYKKMLNFWLPIRSKVKPCWEVLYYMRDAYAHIHQHVKGRQGLYTTENELFTMFPSYMSYFVKIACDIPAFRCVLSTYDEE